MKTMLISVGGAEAPLISSIKAHLPDAVIFFVSRTSRSQVIEKILPAALEAFGKMIDPEFVVTPDEQDIGASTEALLNEVPKAMRKLGSDTPWPDVVDYTGGTKTMSAAVVWASSRFPCQFNYVGGTDRTKNGLGAVVAGAEKHVTLQNPWNRLAYYEIQVALRLFDCGQYARSAETLAGICAKVTAQREGRVLAVLQSIVGGFSQWDVFNHAKALSLFSKNLPSLKDISESHCFCLPDMKPFAAAAESSFQFLKSITPGKLSWPMILDLLANALRRAELEMKYEDATARTYAAIEKIAKLQLESAYGINNAKCAPEQLPEKLREDFTRKYSGGDGTLKFGALASYEVLLHLGDTYGRRFAQLPKVNAHMTGRNHSILGHGFQSMDKPKFDALFDDALKILSVETTSLPSFPKMAGDDRL